MYRLEESERIQRIKEEFGESIPKIFYDLHWDKNLKHREIGKRINVPRSTVTKWFYHFGVPTQSCARFTNLNLEKHRDWLLKNKKPKIKKEFPWHFNKDFFKKWTEEMAYVLGLMISDGYVFINPRGSKYFGITSTDRELVEKVRDILDSNHKIGVKESKNSKWKTRYVLQIGSKDTVEDLAGFGVIERKSLIIKFPSNIPSQFLRHFIRGYFDGDGGVYLGRHWRKDRNKFYWYFQVYFVSGNKHFLEELHYCLKNYVEGGFINEKQRGYALVFSRRDGFALSDFMYQDVSKELFLERKYNIFIKAHQIL
ncbi:hypothetical protein KKC63_00915 [Patescibacteria group bacterium]|nr:hypothetical protein [Patescibacteria group bacterium]MBU4023411.1 hypothetical protein [Patescibacteria group bacterium]MBU4078008.1 hypothetical protein [Patescibacteria group bacterium]